MDRGYARASFSGTGIKHRGLYADPAAKPSCPGNAYLLKQVEVPGQMHRASMYQCLFCRNLIFILDPGRPYAEIAVPVPAAEGVRP